MGPWVVLAALIGGINLMLFILVRGRWGRMVPVLALAALGGAVVGNAVGQRTGLEVLRIGDFHVLAASVCAQLAMLMVTLLAALAPMRAEER
jgi:hypothetical protein